MKPSIFRDEGPPQACYVCGDSIIATEREAFIHVLNHIASIERDRAYAWDCLFELGSATRNLSPAARETAAFALKHRHSSEQTFEMVQQIRAILQEAVEG